MLRVLHKTTSEGYLVILYNLSNYFKLLLLFVRNAQELKN